MPTECSAELFKFAAVDRRAVVAGFDRGAITSDAGALLLGAADPAIGLVDRLAGWFASGTPTILPNPFGAMYDAGGTELAIFQDADVFTWDAYRFL
jgi:hypothetical protein